MKIALVHDWFITNAGSEKVVKQILECYPNAEVFSLVDFLSDKDRTEILNGKEVSTSFLQNMPFAKTHFQKYLQFFPKAIESLDVSGYDIILSSSHAVAKGVLTRSDQLHICYCHTPIRYAWDLYFEYLNDPTLKSKLKQWYAKWILAKIRIWDKISENRPDYYIANSKYVKQRILKTYNKDSEVIYPPVDIKKFTLHNEKENFFVTAMRLVSYKKIDLIVETFSQLPDHKLIVIGDGPRKEYLQSIAPQNIQFLGKVTDEVMVQNLSKAKGFVYAALEDFGILPVEAQACGTPIIAYNKGGTKETVIDGETGVLFNRQEVEELKNAILNFNEKTYNKETIRKHSEKFSVEKFKEKYTNFVEIKWKEFNA